MQRLGPLPVSPMLTTAYLLFLILFTSGHKEGSQQLRLCIYIYNSAAMVAGVASGPLSYLEVGDERGGALGSPPVAQSLLWRPHGTLESLVNSQLPPGMSDGTDAVGAEGLLALIAAC